MTVEPTPLRLVLAVDGSASSIQARDLVASIAWPAGTAVTVVKAYDVPAAWFAEGAIGTGEWLTQADEASRRQIDDELVEIAAPLEGRGWAVDRRTIGGRAADSIMDVADEEDADLIVVGSRGRGQIESMLLGSVSAEVADRARRSVLVARSDGVSRLLVATDGSAPSEVIPAVLGDWGVFRALPAVALSVAPVDSPTFELLVSLYTLGSERLDRDQDRLRELHRGYAASMSARLSESDLRAEAMLRAGDAANEITKAAAEIGADLIVTGSHSLRGLDRWLLGSVARNVLLHAHASVLVIRHRRALGGS
jgi:nucleotide-binding universal stress UspA family protein